jgi:hypothetical protein
LIYINDRHFNSKWIMKPTLGQPALEGHLTSFKSGFGSTARPSSLTFMTPARGFSVP